MREEDIQIILENNKEKGPCTEYWGFDFAGTPIHPTAAHNSELMSYFRIDPLIISRIKSRKGTISLDLEPGVSKEFIGWTSAKILHDLIANHDKYLEAIRWPKIFVVESRIIGRNSRYEVLRRQGWACNICGKRLKFSAANAWEGEVAHIDHIHPYSKRDSYPRGIENINEISNLQALCPRCNGRKSDKEVH